MKLYNEYKTIWYCDNPSGKLKWIKSCIKNILKERKLKVGYDSAGNMYIGDFEKEKPCVVAHLDSVHMRTGKVSLYGDYLTSTQGIGGDDKCGIVACLEIIKYSDVNIIFTVDEEIGGIGARKVLFDKLKNTSYFIEIDRKGSSDVITNLVFGDSVTKEFIEKITPFMNKYKFKESAGTYTDLCDIIPEVEICGINLSAGYYNPHRKTEYIILSELQNTIAFVVELCNMVREKFELPMEYMDIGTGYKDIEYLPDTLDDSLYSLKWLAEDIRYIESITELKEFIYTSYPEYINLIPLIEKAYNIRQKEFENEIENYPFGI